MLEVEKSKYIVIIILCNNVGVNGAVVEAPSSKNISANQNVEFTCATNSSNEIITWSTVPELDVINVATSDIPRGGRYSVMRFFASIDHSSIIIKCIITDIVQLKAFTAKATLLVQGNNKHHCNHRKLKIKCFNNREIVRCW